MHVEATHADVAQHAILGPHELLDLPTVAQGLGEPDGHPADRRDKSGKRDRFRVRT